MSKIASAVVQVVADNMPADGNSLQLEGKKSQPSEVDLILVNRWHCEKPGRWVWLESRATEKDVIGLIQEAINAKALKLSAYMKSCKECWLLLVADSFRASGKLGFDESCQLHTFNSPFARTYVLDFGTGKLHRLQTSSIT